MARDITTPVTFILPDNDQVAVIPWEYVLAKLTKVLEPVNASNKSINESLTAIDTKLDDWIDD